jgi:hypothetical protein
LSIGPIEESSAGVTKFMTGLAARGSAQRYSIMTGGGSIVNLIRARAGAREKQSAMIAPVNRVLHG